MSFHDCGPIGGGWPHSAHDPPRFVVLPPLTKPEAVAVRNALWNVLRPNDPVEVDEAMLWSLHTAYAEAVANLTY